MINTVNFMAPEITLPQPMESKQSDNGSKGIAFSGKRFVRLVLLTQKHGQVYLTE
ncbi:hypothetical protein [Desulfosporosinus sp. BG]|uniref:hypothetical protein n=1 Tax=Desulfosporosinus sp. BG TaxID=1633135 RepID=UPI00159F020C|nr:hypothetical protein [Desulfosporosinus sp. BG]